MARTKGAKDKGTRRKPPTRPPAKPAIPRMPPGGSQPKVESKTGDGGPPPRADPRGASAAEFQAAIAAELKQASVSIDPGRTDAASTSSSPPVPASFDPSALTIEGLASAWQFPFYVLASVLAFFRIAPDPEPLLAVGRRRAPDLAKPSYVIYEQLAQRYLGFHPENTVHVAVGVTVLDAIGIVPDVIEAVRESRRRAGVAGAQVTPAPAPPPAST